MSTTTPRAGDIVSGIVLASSNVASVEIRIDGFSANLNKIDVGHFEGSYRIPQLPFFVTHTLAMRIIARNTAGAAIERDVAFRIR